LYSWFIIFVLPSITYITIWHVVIGAEAAVLPELGHQQTFVFVQFDLVNLSNFYCIYENIYKNI